MMRQSEFKMKYSPETGKYTKQHIYGEGINDKFKSFSSNLFGKPSKKDTKKAVTFASKTNKHASKKAGDKILKMLSREKLPTTPKKMTQQEINNRVLQIMSGGKII